MSSSRSLSLSAFSSSLPFSSATNHNNTITAFVTLITAPSITIPPSSSYPTPESPRYTSIDHSAPNQNQAGELANNAYPRKITGAVLGAACFFALLGIVVWFVWWKKNRRGGLLTSIIPPEVEEGFGKVGNTGKGKERARGGGGQGEELELGGMELLGGGNRNPGEGSSNEESEVGGVTGANGTVRTQEGETQGLEQEHGQCEFQKKKGKEEKKERKKIRII
ncbi:hypothetical protein BCR34DRAFT_227828 [Clohesyomyces aquaticus]|uniref:Uncharacterized protein n=1 Tax=Clohesyomyces aquaticus TaxID=1231657 RepID=A0A1Y1ZW97_9PLEO|nr:hypothetical protein BCR34DRAFT_227828 [Clohesyomyces aquaticus]